MAAELPSTEQKFTETSRLVPLKYNDRERIEKKTEVLEANSNVYCAFVSLRKQTYFRLSLTRSLDQLFYVARMF